MQQITLRPDGLAYSSGSFNLGGGASTYYGATNDNNDSTYFYFIGSGGEIGLHFNSYTLGANQRCAGARLVHRMRGTGYGDFSLDTWLRGSGFGDGSTGWFYGADLPNWTTFWNGWYVRDFTQAMIDSFEGHYRNNPPGTTTASITESYIDIDVRTQPTCAIVSPTTDQRLMSQTPTITWTQNAQGDSLIGHRVKIFTDAVKTGGGFNPDTSGTVWDSGDVGNANTSEVVGTPLTYGATYWAYVQVANDYIGAWWRSNWSSVRFIINSPASAGGSAGTTLPVVTPATPITTTNKPTVAWTYYDVDSDAQAAWQVKIFSSAVYGAGGFNADTASAAWDSGATAGTAVSVVTGGLSPNVTYKAYVKVSDVGTSGRWSAWIASATFIIQTAAGYILDPPATPEIISATVDNTNQRVVVAVQGRDNLLTRNQSTGDSGNIGFEPDANLTAANLVRDATTYLQGGGAWKMTPTVNGTTMAMRTTRVGGNQIFPVTPLRTYTAYGSVQSASTTRVAQMLIRWYTSAFTLISTTTGGNVNSVSTGFTQATASAAAPATAAWAELVPTVVTPSEVHYWDNLGFVPGTSTTWFRGGLLLELGNLVDSFNRADSAVSLGSADTGGAWTAAVGTWGIAGNKAYCPYVPTTNAIAFLTSSHLSDGYVQADITLSPTLNRAVVGIAFHALDANNLMMVDVGKTVAADSITIWKRIAGVWTSLATVTGAGLVNGTTYTVKVEFFGGQVNVYVNGTSRLTYLMLVAELNQFGSYGGYGIRVDQGAASDDGGSRFDNFIAKAPDTQLLTVERSLDAGVTWATLRNGGSLVLLSDQLATINDYEVPAGVVAQYRAKVVAAESINVLTSAYSAVVSQSAALAVASAWWLKDPLNPTANMVVEVEPPFDFRRKEPQAVYDPLGRKTSIVVTDGPKGIEGTLTLWSKSKTTYDALQALINSGHVLLLTDPFGRFWYIKLGDSHSWSLLRAQPATGETTPIRHLHTVSLPFAEVAAPA